MFAEVATSNMGQVRAAILDFAMSLDWEDAGGGMIMRPGGGLPINIDAATPPELRVSMVAGATTVFANVRPPWVALDFLLPTRAFLFGNNEQEPFVAVVVEFGFNNYRHLYLGNMIKAGNYTGGEVLCSNAQADDNSPSTGDNIEYWRNAKFLFSACNGHNGGLPTFDGRAAMEASTSGGVNINHADNANQIRRFHGPTGNAPYENFTGTEVFGGARDSWPNSDLQKYGLSAFTGGAILTPPSLMVPNGANGANYRIRPIGIVPGAMFVNMQNITPEQEVLIGTQTWKCFPEFGRSPSPTMGARLHSGARHGYGASNSQYLGLAYPKD